MPITQKQITTHLTIVVLTITVLITIRLLSIFLPPFILNVETNKVEPQIIIKGFKFGTKDKNSIIFINGTRIPEKNIISWRPLTIKVKYAFTDNNFGTLEIHRDNKKSNVKNFILFDRVSTYSKQKNRTPLATIDTQLLNKNKIAPYNKIMLSLFETKQYNWTLQIANNTFKIPNYLWQTDTSNNTIFLMLYDGLWNLNLQLQAKNYILTAKNFNHEFSITLPIEIISLPITRTSEYSINFSYNDPSKENTYFLPLQTLYQHIEIKNKKVNRNSILAFDVSNFKYNIPLYTLPILITIDNSTLTTNQNTLEPVFYNNEIIFEYLFNHATNTFIKKYIAPFIVPALNPPSLQKILQEPLQENTHLYINSVLNYVASIDKNSFIDFLQQKNNKIFALDMNLTHTQNLLAAYLLRTQNIIARTIVGYQISITTNAKNKTQYNANFLSWIEILSPKMGWVHLDTNGVFALEQDTIALFVLEQYIDSNISQQNPLIPLDISVNNITRK